MQLYNSLTRQKEPLTPLKPKKIGLYVCGMTVYDLCHVGHARVMVVFDAFTRFLRSQGIEVTYVRNVTDIDDKIIRKAQEENTPWQTITARFEEAMRADAKALGVLPPTHEPRATEAIPGMLRIIETLMQKGAAYQSANGDVYYSVNAFANYGCLSHHTLSDLQAGARVELGEQKHNPLDFVLWKAAKPGEPSWPSPWGEGRPGWHIECSAMAIAALGETFDIHGGGLDLKFPHHENEIAQSEMSTGKPFVKTWMHVGFVQINQEKMSKSLGNFFTIREVLKQYPAEVIRLFLLSSHYRSPVNYTEEQLNHAVASLERLYTALNGVETSGNESILEEYEARFTKALEDDFNTPEALSVLHDLARELNKHRGAPEALQYAHTLKKLGEVIGLLQQTPESFLQRNTQVSAEEIEGLIKARELARAQKDWVGADRIRDSLRDRGIELEDGAGGTTWRVI